MTVTERGVGTGASRRIWVPTPPRCPGAVHELPGTHWDSSSSEQSDEAETVRSHRAARERRDGVGAWNRSNPTHRRFPLPCCCVESRLNPRRQLCLSEQKFSVSLPELNVLKKISHCQYLNSFYILNIFLTQTCVCLILLRHIFKPNSKLCLVHPLRDKQIK